MPYRPPYDPDLFRQMAQYLKHTREVLADLSALMTIEKLRLLTVISRQITIYTIPDVSKELRAQNENFPFVKTLYPPPGAGSLPTTHDKLLATALDRRMTMIIDDLDLAELATVRGIRNIRSSIVPSLIILQDRDNFLEKMDLYSEKLKNQRLDDGELFFAQEFMGFCCGPISKFSADGS